MNITDEMLEVEILTEQLKDTKKNKRFWQMEIVKFERLLMEALDN